MAPLHHCYASKFCHVPFSFLFFFSFNFIYNPIFISLSHFFCTFFFLFMFILNFGSMDWRILDIKLRDFFKNSRSQLVSLSRSCRDMELGLVSLLWLFSSRSTYLNLALGSLDFLRFSPIYVFFSPIVYLLVGI